MSILSQGYNLNVTSTPIFKTNLLNYGGLSGRAVEDAVVNATTTIISATASFSSSDVGSLFTVCDQANYQNVTNGTIVSVQSATSITVSVAPSWSATSCSLALGPNNATAINNAISSLVVTRNSSLCIPWGIYLTNTANVTIPDGYSCFGDGVVPYGKATTALQSGSAILLATTVGSGVAVINHGSGTNATNGQGTTSVFEGVGVDACNNADFAILSQCRRGIFKDSCAWRGKASTYIVYGQNQEIKDSKFGAQLIGNVVNIQTSDVKFVDNQVRQGGNPSASATTGHQIFVNMVNQNNVLIDGNHMYTGTYNGSISASAQGSNVFISATGSTPATFANVVNNSFDGTYGPQITIRNSGSSRLSNINVVGNMFFQTTGFPDNTFPVISIQPIGGSIRALTICGNTANGQVNNFSSFIAIEAGASGSVASNPTHVTVTGNTGMGVDAIFKGGFSGNWSPENHSNNVFAENFTITLYRSNNYGKSTFNGDGTTTQFTIAHGLDRAPAWATYTAGTAASSGVAYVTSDATNIYVNYVVAPVIGTNNVVVNWQAGI